MILIDTSEPDTIVTLLQQALPVTKAPLNQSNMADYFFGNYEGKTRQFNRVQSGELVGNVDSMEDELKRYYDQADETNMIIEGLLSPVRLYMPKAAADVSLVGEGRSGGGSTATATGSIVSSRDLGAKVFCYPVEPDGFIKHGHSFTTTRMSELYAWIYRLGQYGVHTYYTNNWEETARFLIATWRNEQKSPEEHQTFKRIYRPKVYIKHEKDMSPEELSEYRLTKALLLLSSAYNLGIGEVKARELASRYCNIMDVSLASISDITETKGIGRTQAEKLLRALGRDV